MCGDLLPELFRRPRVLVLTVRSEIDLEPVVLELYELEVTPPREDFELEVKRTLTMARSGDIGSVRRARAGWPRRYSWSAR